jgi:beta-glucosidase/6-phospho-beta-glucosidase/beta-galactosidase
MSASSDSVSSDVDSPPEASLSFPEGFMFGSAVAGFQVDMGCPTIAAEECEDRNSDWYAFVTSEVTQASSSTFLSGHPTSAGPGHYELYEQDFDRVANELMNNSFRFSIEWSRVFPTATDGVQGYDALRAIASSEALDYYHSMLAALRARGIEPLVTVNHYSLPLWMHDVVACHQDLSTCANKGWVDRQRIVVEIAKYGGFLAQEFGAEIDNWATLNEPFAVVLPGYILPSSERTNPPAVVLKVAEAKQVLAAMIEAHARIYDALHEYDSVDANGDGHKAFVGVVYNLVPFFPKDPENVLDVQAAENLFYLWNLAFLDGAIFGKLDEDLDGEAEVREDLEGRMDYVGINYYTRAVVEGTSKESIPGLSPLATFNLASLELWEEYPEGLYQSLMLVEERYGLPSIVTENGVFDLDDPQSGPRFLTQHLAATHKAIEEGADVRGYFYWTLMDNYEWNHGMNVRMGLYAVDKDDPEKKRVARPIAATYRTICEANGIPQDILDAYLYSDENPEKEGE